MQRDSSFYSRAGSTRESPVILPPTAAVGREQPIARATSCRAMAAAVAASTARAACNPSSSAVPDPSDHVWAHHFNLLNSAPAPPAAPHLDPSRATTSSLDEASVSVSNASDLEATEWVEQDEPGVSITIREFGDGTRELRRVRFRQVNGHTSYSFSGCKIHRRTSNHAGNLVMLMGCDLAFLLLQPGEVRRG